MNLDAMECLFKYSQIYAEYIVKGLVTFDELFVLIEDREKITAFEALGKYPNAVETLLKLFVSFKDLYIFGSNEPKKFADLLQDINNPDSQMWIMQHSPMLNDICIAQEKIDILRINILDFSLFMHKYNCRIDDILKLPLTVLENFVENDFQDVILINEIFGGVRLLSSIRTKHADFGNAIFSSQEPHY